MKRTISTKACLALKKYFLSAALTTKTSHTPFTCWQIIGSKFLHMEVKGFAKRRWNLLAQPPNFLECIPILGSQHKLHSKICDQFVVLCFLEAFDNWSWVRCCRFSTKKKCREQSKWGTHLQWTLGKLQQKVNLSLPGENNLPLPSPPCFLCELLGILYRSLYLYFYFYLYIFFDFALLSPLSCLTCSFFNSFSIFFIYCPESFFIDCLVFVFLYVITVLFQVFLY